MRSQTTDVKDIGRQFDTSDEIPCLKTGVILAIRQALGIFPTEKICAYTILRGPANINFKHFKKQLLKPWGSAVLTFLYALSEIGKSRYQW